MRRLGFGSELGEYGNVLTDGCHDLITGEETILSVCTSIGFKVPEGSPKASHTMGDEVGGCLSGTVAGSQAHVFPELSSLQSLQAVWIPILDICYISFKVFHLSHARMARAFRHSPRARLRLGIT